MPFTKCCARYKIAKDPLFKGTPVLKKILNLSIFVLLSVKTIYAFPGLHVPKDQEVIKRYGKSQKTSLNPESIDLFVWNIYKAEYYQWEKQFTSQIENFDLFH